MLLLVVAVVVVVVVVTVAVCPLILCLLLLVLSFSRAHRKCSTVPTTQLAKMSIEPKFVELTADVLETF